MAKAKTKVSNKVKESRADKAFDVTLFIILTLILIIVAYPLYFVIIASISDPQAVSGGDVTFLPVGFSLDGYAEVFKDTRVMRSFVNSIFYTTVGTCINLIVTIPTAYTLSRRQFAGKKFVTFFYMVTMFVSGGMIPTYLVVKNMQMLDTMWSLIVPGAMSVYNMIVARTFFESSLPEELFEAATVDGCGHTKFFFKIALPLSKAIIAIMVLYYGIGHWNNYFSALLYMKTEDKYPLQLVLRSILISNEANLSMAVTTPEMQQALQEQQALVDLMKYSLIIVSSIPVMILYPFIQKHFVKGVMIGSVKG